ncbi:hypothetical protein SDC9_56717 [bioreactor metagenome]|uniref:Uncharacterized protein n=1 Tax=bioreactor metagenome TaxID=1076179 RepID=A0A644X2N8_9ZZZZ
MRTAVIKMLIRIEAESPVIAFLCTYFLTVILLQTLNKIVIMMSNKACDSNLRKVKMRHKSK